MKFTIRKNTKVNAFTDFNMGKIKALVMRKIGNKMVVIDKIELKYDQTTVRYKNKDFSHFDKDLIYFSDAENNYYAFDFDTGNQLGTGTKQFPDKFTVDDIDVYVNRNIIAQLASGLEKIKQEKGKFIIIILAGVLGGIIGFMIGQSVAQQPIQAQLAILGII